MALSNSFILTNLENYVNNWNWSVLSENTDVNWTFEMIEEFKKNVDWEAFTQNYQGLLDINLINHSLYSIDFFERFQEYIPIENIQKTSLWHAMIDESKLKLAEKLLLE